MYSASVGKENMERLLLKFEADKEIKNLDEPLKLL